MIDPRIQDLKNILLENAKWKSSDQAANVTYRFEQDKIQTSTDLPTNDSKGTITDFDVFIENDVLILKMLDKHFTVISSDLNKIELQHPLGHRLSLAKVG